MTTSPPDYNLTFFRRDDGKRFVGRRIQAAEYILMDPETGEKARITYHKFKKGFVSSPDNFQNRRKTFNQAVRPC